MMFVPDHFKSMGRAIEERHRRCALWWRPHLDHTTSFINQHVPQAASVAVLGAGRLLDIDIEGLLSRCETVHLFDADSGAVAYWRSRCATQYGRRVVGHVLDLTECMKEWSRGLAAAIRAARLREYLESCEAVVPTWAFESFDGCVSLNIAGQIPLYWRDRVLAAASELSPDEWVALQGSMERLQVAHLRGLLTRDNAWSILVTDTEYYFYHCDRSEWRVEPAFFGEANEVFRAGFMQGKHDTWLWHIAPQFIESDEEGEIHRVEARVVMPKNHRE